MSAQTALSLPKGFLREFQFSTLGQAVIADLMGEVRIPHWLSFTITNAPSAADQSFLFTIKVTAQPHERLMRYAIVGTTGHDTRRVGLEKKREFEFPFAVPWSVVEQFREKIPTLFETWLKKTLKENAFRLYELDPRVGWCRETEDAVLPRSPLFDPPEKFSRTGIPSMAASDPGVEPVCPFCDRSHSVVDPPVWLGANLMWAHRGCWEGLT